MKRVALITIHSVPNYGSVLQTYATIRAIEKNGMECELIDYRYPKRNGIMPTGSRANH